MKKIYLTLALFVSFGILSAQQVSVLSTTNFKKEVSDISKADMQRMAKAENQNYKNRTQATKATESRWYNAAFTINDILSGVSTVSANNIFPDTTILVDYGTEFSGPWIHSVAECVDPFSQWYDISGEMDMRTNVSYTVDTIGFYCIYQRNTAASVVDTLLVQVRNSGTGYRFWANNAHFQTNYGVDTCAFRPVAYDLGKYYSTDSNVVTIKLPLTANSINDTTASGWNYFQVAPASAYIVPAGEQVIVSFSFIPGYTWIPNLDTLTSFNRIRFVSYEELGDDTYPSYTKWDFTSAYIQNTEDLYDPAPTSYTSHLAYLNTYSYEHHWVEVLLSQEKVGVESSKSNILSVGQNRPNPFTGSTIIDYNLDKAANVSVAIYNVAGAQIMNLNEGLKSVGNHNMTINANNLPAGVYYYTLTADNYSVTKKMIVY